MEKEKDYDYSTQLSYEEVTEVTDYMDDWIETKQEDKEGVLLMYRDSFGESLIPFFAQEMKQSYFSRLTPYYLEQIKEYQPEYVVIEIVERNIKDLLEKTPIMQTAPVAPIEYKVEKSNSTIELEKDGGYIVVKGEVSEAYLQEDSSVYLGIEGAEGQEFFYPTFRIITEDGREGYCLYLSEYAVPQGAEIKLICSGSENIMIKTTTNDKN